MGSQQKIDEEKTEGEEKKLKDEKMSAEAESQEEKENEGKMDVKAAEKAAMVLKLLAIAAMMSGVKAQGGNEVEDESS